MLTSYLFGLFMGAMTAWMQSYPYMSWWQDAPPLVRYGHLMHQRSRKGQKK